MNNKEKITSGFPKLFKKRSVKSGLIPGSLVHIGEKNTKKIKITVIDYTENEFQEKIVETAKECFAYKDKASITWINIDGVHDPKLIEELGKCYEIHPLVLEDILNTDQRPKVENYEKFVYIVLKMIFLKTEAIMVEQVSLIIGDNYILSFQENIGADTFEPIRETIRQSKGLIRKMGPDYLAYRLMDSVIDNYFIIIEKLGDNFEALEDELIKSPSPETLKSIHSLKRKMIFLRKSVWPLREVISRLERGEIELIKNSSRPYFRDIYDHTIQIIDNVETFRDMLSGMLDIYLSSVSNRLNEVMKVLTIIATIFMPLTFIAGVYGMNFKYMPELDWEFGYPSILIFMVLVTLFMIRYFRKKGWI